MGHIQGVQILEQPFLGLIPAGKIALIHRCVKKFSIFVEGFLTGCHRQIALIPLMILLLIGGFQVNSFSIVLGGVLDPNIQIRIHMFIPLIIRALDLIGGGIPHQVLRLLLAFIRTLAITAFTGIADTNL